MDAQLVTLILIAMKVLTRDRRTLNNAAEVTAAVFLTNINYY